jgi:hypothetical protein
MRRTSDYLTLFTWGTDGVFYAPYTIQVGTLKCTSVLQMTQGQSIQLIPGDGNHSLQYNAATPTGSGEANNGPELRGYSSIWLRTIGSNHNFFLGSAGHVYIDSGKVYSYLSSRNIKKDIEELSIQDCLNQVLRWRPVKFKWIENDEYGEGFIAEEMDEVTPYSVSRDGPEAFEPGKVNGIGYSNLTTQLAGAVQALNSRIEELEKKVA